MNPEKGSAKAPVLTGPSLLSDANKIAWMRAYLGWAYKCVSTGDPLRDMIPHDGLVHFIVELYANQGVALAKPLSECGQELPVYAAGKERRGDEGLSTSDWGNKTFVSAARKSGLCVRPVLTRVTWKKLVLMQKQLRSVVRFSCQNADVEKQGEGCQQQIFSACLVALKVNLEVFT